MKVFQTRTIPEQKQQVCTKRNCDICGAEGKYDWDSGIYEVKETEVRVAVRCKKGYAYPEGGWGTVYDIDICPRCFVYKLVPWLESLGAEIQEAEWDF